jgi:hypothetical protein
VAAKGILVRKNILFPSSPPVVAFSSQHLSVAWADLDNLDPNFAGLIAGKPWNPAVSGNTDAPSR